MNDLPREVQSEVDADNCEKNAALRIYQCGLRDAKRDDLFERAAIAAMQGILANPDEFTGTDDQLAMMAVKQAAALVAAIREHTKPVSAGTGTTTLMINPSGRITGAPEV